MKPGTRIVSNSFTMDTWQADRTVTAKTRIAPPTARLICGSCPAKVEGTWRVGDGQLTLKQEFQMISGTLKSGGNAMQITNGKLAGDQISFFAGADQYTGRVNGNAMTGTVRSGNTAKSWSATRTGALATK